MKTLALIFFSLIASSLFAQETNPATVTPQKMEWFEDAKLGIFIHDGIYAVNGIAESWSFKNNKSRSFKN